MTWPIAPDSIAEIQMLPLLERGREALRAYLDSFAPEDRPIGGSTLSVIRLDDFIKHAGLCVRHVQNNGASLYVLCENGDLCALISKLTWRRS